MVPFPYNISRCLGGRMSFFEIIISFSGHAQHDESKYFEVIAAVPGYVPFQSSTVP